MSVPYLFDVETWDATSTYQELDPTVIRPNLRRESRALTSSTGAGGDASDSRDMGAGGAVGWLDGPSLVL